jgi:outer membrane protein assembly factor BamB/predicted MPP superfamily phosphohydrolase
MKCKQLLFLIISFVLPGEAFTQSFKFAFLSDTHIGIKNADEDLRRSVADINADTSLKFVVITGDITELGTDEEILLAKSILSELKKPLYIQTGNHDGNWSPNGGRIFNKAFGPGRFSFQYNGYLFIGTNSGPNMHHKAPGQVPREDILWMDSILNKVKDKNIPVVYTNHYPQDSSQRNWYEVMDRLKKRNLQLFLVGHGHLNTQFTFEGVPGIMGRSNMRAADPAGAYNVVTFANGIATFEERKMLTNIQTKWAEAKLYDHGFNKDTTHYRRPSYAINNSYPHVKMLWQYQNKFDIGAGVALKNNLIIATNTGGAIYAMDKNNGQRKWTFQTKGKIYSSPVVSSHYVVVASADSLIYCLHAVNGKLAWKYRTLKPIVASPSIINGVVYIGSSGGEFRAFDLANGKIKWVYNGIKDFVMTRPLLYNGKIYFGSWGNEFYALNMSDGKLAWKWKDTSNNRMFSPAGCRPVAAGGKIFIVAPDQYMTAFNAETGNIIWRVKNPNIRVRESMGLSADSSFVYVKTTDGKLYGISIPATGMETMLHVNLQIGYDICATPVMENKGVIYVPSNSGVVSAVDRQTGKLLWKHKVSNSNIISLNSLDNNQLIAATVDGKIICLQF